MKRIIQAVICSFLGLVTLIFALSGYKEVAEPGMSFLPAMLTVIYATLMIFTTSLSFSWGVFSFSRIRDKYLPKPKYRMVNNYTVPVGLVLILVIANLAGSSAAKIQGENLGFLSETEFSEAKQNKIFSTEEYSLFMKYKKIKHEAEAIEKAAEKTEQDRIAKTEEYVNIFIHAKDKAQVRGLINKDLKDNPELARRIFSEIASYASDSLERDLAESDYVDNGVSFREYMNTVEHSNCRQELKTQLAPYTAWKNGQDWRPLSEFPKSMQKQEMYRRDVVNTDYLRKKTELENIFHQCAFSLISSIPHFSRPNAKPLVSDEYFPERLQCVQRNGGDYKECYP